MREIHWNSQRHTGDSTALIGCNKVLDGLRRQMTGKDCSAPFRGSLSLQEATGFQSLEHPHLGSHPAHTVSWIASRGVDPSDV
jgi:hypothetical protein